MTENAAWEREQVTRQYWSIRDIGECVDEIVRLQASEEVARRRGELLREAQKYVGAYHMHQSIYKIGKVDDDPCERCALRARIDAELKGA